jgi:hypothetical protein
MKKKYPENSIIATLAEEMCLAEDGKKQVSIAQMKEILNKLSALLYAHPVYISALIIRGSRDDV